MKKTLEFPTVCPSCGGPVHLDDQKVNLWCDNPTCPAQLERRVLHWIKTLDILGVGEGIVGELCQHGFVKDVPDLYFLSIEQIVAATGGKSSAQKVQTAILEKYDIPLAVFLDGLGIDGLGTTTSKLVAKEFQSLRSIRLCVKNDKEHGVAAGLVARLTAIDGIGPLTAQKIIDGLRMFDPMIARLEQALDIQEVVVKSGPLTGMSFLITGTLSVGRKEMETLIEKNAGTMVSSVGKKLNYLVVGDAPGSKLDKAKKLGIAILSEGELRKMML